jgi:hypothetical protein
VLAHGSSPTTRRASWGGLGKVVNYRAKAEVYHRLRRSLRQRTPLAYKRFKTAADAIRFAIEQLPDYLLPGSYMDVDEERYDAQEIRRLYESEAYPLKRRARP